MIGEMIEVAETASAALSLGIDYGQGWLFGKPVEFLTSSNQTMKRVEDVLARQ
jgi:EAL domain-containing protein (putative c-di-GMP-specific phosphodiesterase class I)